MPGSFGHTFHQSLYDGKHYFFHSFSSNRSFHPQLHIVGYPFFNITTHPIDVQKSNCPSTMDHPDKLLQCRKPMVIQNGTIGLGVVLPGIMTKGLIKKKYQEK
ncbi:hypothetical protein TNCV_888291 [Trichonephila clavipes]|nr:hypothetical protein TNCV_888291 [Trichonephila clavipes]